MDQDEHLALVRSRARVYGTTNVVDTQRQLEMATRDLLWTLAELDKAQRAALAASRG